jgi:gliding motility-associated-like protein
VVKIQPSPTANSPQSFCISQNAALSNLVIGGQNIKWYDSLTSGSIPDTIILQNGLNYYASQTIDNCESNRILINTRILATADCDLTIDNDAPLSYPKFFTPNGDGFNDNWKIKFSDNEIGLSIQLFDRYGKLIKELQNNIGWDGTFNGHELPLQIIGLL